MEYIQTVLGTIKPEELGVTNYHDHLITIGGGEEKAPCVPKRGHTAPFPLRGGEADRLGAGQGTCPSPLLCSSATRRQSSRALETT